MAHRHVTSIAALAALAALPAGALAAPSAAANGASTCSGTMTVADANNPGTKLRITKLGYEGSFNCTRSRKLVRAFHKEQLGNNGRVRIGDMRCRFVGRGGYFDKRGATIRCRGEAQQISWTARAIKR